jgi:hypothetical protein
MAYTYKQLKNNLELMKNANGQVELLCEGCCVTFFRDKNHVYSALYRGGRTFCSKSCSDKAHILRQDVECDQCHKVFTKRHDQIGKYPHNFCGLKCTTTYHNIHNTYVPTGKHRSKMELWLENQLITDYPNQKIMFNDRLTINAELDIYFPNLTLAFELNGIFHYEPIHGQEKLTATQTNDHRKFAACIEKGISLCVIDISMIKHFKPVRGLRFLKIITDIVNAKLV